MTEGTFDGVVMQGTGGIWQVRTDDGALFGEWRKGDLSIQNIFLPNIYQMD